MRPALICVARELSAGIKCSCRRKTHGEEETVRPEDRDRRVDERRDHLKAGCRGKGIRIAMLGVGVVLRVLARLQTRDVLFTTVSDHVGPAKIQREEPSTDLGSDPHLALRLRPGQA